MRWMEDVDLQRTYRATRIWMYGTPINSSYIIWRDARRDNEKPLDRQRARTWSHFART